ncbi:MAG TPA: NUDIX domain-containing protein [Thermoplasmata archaeon]|nr:NUDIX domain-containing protein [Thermoplasmata archaeon]
MTFVYAIAFVDDMFVMVKNKLRESWEMPGGKVEQGEDEVDAVKREFSEETGMRFVPVAKTSLSKGVVFFGRAEKMGSWPWLEDMRDKKLSEKAELSEVPMSRTPKLADDVSEVSLFDQLPRDISFRRDEYERMLQEARSAVKKYLSKRNRALKS